MHVSTLQKSALLGTANILWKVLSVWQELQYQCLLQEIEDSIENEMIHLCNIEILGKMFCHLWPKNQQGADSQAK